MKIICKQYIFYILFIKSVIENLLYGISYIWMSFIAVQMKWSSMFQFWY